MAKAKTEKKKAVEAKTPAATGPTIEASKGRAQQSLPGTARPTIKAVDDAGYDLRKKYLALMKARKNYKDAREHMKMLMLEHKVKATVLEDDEGDEVEFELDQPEAQVKMRKVEEE